MEKIIKIGKQEVKLDNSVAWTMEYYDQFGKDIIPVIVPLIATATEGIASVVADTGGNIKSIADVASALEGRTMDVLLPMYQIGFVDTVINILWAMAKAADEDIDPPKKWVRQFDSFPLDVILPTIYDLVLKGFVSSKNLKRLKGIGATLKNLQPSISTTSSSQESNED